MVFFCHPVPARGSHHMDINDNPFQAKDESEQNIDVVDTRSSDISAGVNTRLRIRYLFLFQCI